MKSGCPLEYGEYKANVRFYKNKCRRDRNKGWNKFTEEIKEPKDISKLSKKLQNTSQKTIDVFEKRDGSTTDPGLDTLLILVKTHFPSATPLRGKVFNSKTGIETKKLVNKFDWISNAKIKEALNTFEKKKSPGPDGLKPLIFEYLPERYIDYLNLIYTSCIHFHYTPRLWRDTKVIFIPKPGKDNYRKPKAFRPISLSNYFLKGLERLVAWKMDESLIKYPIHKKQHGFQSGKSTDSAISNTVNYIESFVFKNEYALGIFLDISSAFDSICPVSYTHLTLPTTPYV